MIHGRLRLDTWQQAAVWFSCSWMSKVWPASEWKQSSVQQNEQFLKGRFLPRACWCFARNAHHSHPLVRPGKAAANALGPARRACVPWNHLKARSRLGRTQLPSTSQAGFGPIKCNYLPKTSHTTCFEISPLILTKQLISCRYNQAVTDEDILTLCLSNGVPKVSFCNGCGHISLDK